MVQLAEVSKAFWSWQELIFGSEVSSMAQVDFCGCVTFVFFLRPFCLQGSVWNVMAFHEVSMMITMFEGASWCF
jgi:hypothetical protein